jgi:hypothetical protein
VRHLLKAGRWACARRFSRGGSLPHQAQRKKSLILNGVKG